MSSSEESDDSSYHQMGNHHSSSDDSCEWTTEEIVGFTKRPKKHVVTASAWIDTKNGVEFWMYHNGAYLEKGLTHYEEGKPFHFKMCGRDIDIVNGPFYHPILWYKYFTDKPDDWWGWRSLKVPEIPSFKSIFKRDYGISKVSDSLDKTDLPIFLDRRYSLRLF